MEKVKITLTPYTALAILSFCREYVNDEVKGDLKFKAIYDSVAEYESEVYKKLSLDQLEDASVENSVNKLTGKWPTA